MGSALSTFNDFVNSTGPSFLTSADAVVNEAVKNNYLLRRFLRGADKAKIIQGGRVIRDEILLDEQSTFQYYQPNETFAWKNPQVLTEWEINWRFAVDHMSWTDQEIELNVYEGMTSSARHQVYKRVKRVKEQRMWTSLLNGMEDQLFAVPEVTKMESATGTEPYSLPAFINEEANTLFGSTATGAPGSAWTTVEGIASATESKWRNQVVTYTNPNANPPGTGSPNVDNIINAFDEMYLKVRFDTPPTRQQYFEDPHLNAQFIACSRRGQNTYRQIMRASQDTYVTTSRQDPAYNQPQYSGIDLVYVSTLDSAALYSHSTASSALQAEIGANTANSGPRFYWINGNYICPVFHTRRYMYMHDTMRHPNQPFTTVRPTDCWYNCVARSRQRHGIVTPSGAVYS